jgi:branched-chain amino acid transport system substrate-binding protein
MEYAVKQINDAGGVNGSRLQLDVQDVGSTAATALSAARIFAQNKDVAVVGYSLTTQNLAVTPVFQQAKIISMLGTASTANNFEKTGDKYNFIFNIPDDETAQHQVSFAIDTLHAKKFALMLDSTAFGKTYGTLVTPLITAGGGSVVETQYMNPDANDASTQAAKILSSHADVALIALLTAPTTTLFFSEMKKQGGANQPPIIGAATVVGGLGKGIPWAGAQGVYGTYMTAGMYDSGALSPANKSWYDATNDPSISPSDNDAEIHDMFLALAAGIESTGGTDPDKLADYLGGLKDFGGWKNIKTVSGPYTCAATHQCLHAQFMGQVKGEALVQVKRYTS